MRYTGTYSKYELWDVVENFFYIARSNICISLHSLKWKVLNEVLFEITYVKAPYKYVCMHEFEYLY